MFIVKAHQRDTYFQDLRGLNMLKLKLPRKKVVWLKDRLMDSFWRLLPNNTNW